MGYEINLVGQDLNLKNEIYISTTSECSHIAEATTVSYVLVSIMCVCVYIHIFIGGCEYVSWMAT